MFTSFSGIFKSKADQPRSELPPKPKCYIALAEPVYGQNIDIDKLMSGEFDSAFENRHLFLDYCRSELFTDESQAIKNANSRSVTKDSAYVLGFNCSPKEVGAIITAGQFSKHIILAKNVRTHEVINKVTAKTPDY